MSFKKSDKKDKGKDSKKLRHFLSGSPPSVPGGGAMPEAARTKLWELFGQIEQQFEQLYTDNAALHERIDKLEHLMSSAPTSTAATPDDPFSSTPLGEAAYSHTTSRMHKLKNSGQTITQRLKTYTPSKKGRAAVTPECSQVLTYSPHRDGVWDVTHSHNGYPIIGTASADGTACVCDVGSGAVITRYVGHNGSVNSVTFHPSEPLACTASGDTTAHIWQNTVILSPRQRGGNNAADKSHLKHDSSGEDRNYSDEEGAEFQDSQTAVAVVKAPLLTLQEHKAAVMSCNWMSDGKRLVTASWDHTAKLWDSDSGKVIHSLEGHDQELTHVCTHPTQQLVVTSSLDTTFRLWDFRAPPIHSVNVFQGHSKAVNSAVFSLRENVVSGSDDHTVKIWDLRNMRSPVDSLRLDCGVNRIAVSHDDHHLLAVPMDNRQVRLYDLSGNRVANLPRRNRQGHRRMVYSVAWSRDSSERCNFFSAGFDNKVIGWKIST